MLCATLHPHREGTHSPTACQPWPPPTPPETRAQAADASPCPALEPAPLAHAIWDARGRRRRRCLHYTHMCSARGSGASPCALMSRPGGAVCAARRCAGAAAADAQPPGRGRPEERVRAHPHSASGRPPARQPGLRTTAARRCRPSCLLVNCPSGLIAAQLRGGGRRGWRAGGGGGAVADRADRRPCGHEQLCARVLPTPAHLADDVQHRHECDVTQGHDDDSDLRRPGPGPHADRRGLVRTAAAAAEKPPHALGAGWGALVRAAHAAPCRHGLPVISSGPDCRPCRSS